MSDDPDLLRLYPDPGATVARRGLYLGDDPVPGAPPERCGVYTNFVASLDGRIAVTPPGSDRLAVPGAVANPRDWGLFLELAAWADALLVSGRYLRELAAGDAQTGVPLARAGAPDDLLDWRRRRGLDPEPAVVVMSASLDLPPEALEQLAGRTVYVATGARPPAARAAGLERAGVSLLQAGSGRRADAGALVRILAARGIRRLYSIAGPHVLRSLLEAQVLDRLYLTQVHRLLGGDAYATLVEGASLAPPPDFALAALYYDPPGRGRPGQTFSVLDRQPGAPAP